MIKKIGRLINKKLLILIKDSKKKPKNHKIFDFLALKVMLKKN